MHPEAAAGLKVGAADRARVSSLHGSAILRVLISDRIGRGQVFAPMHWTSQYASSGRIDAVVSANVDPASGQPESKASAVRIEKYQANWFGFAVTVNRPDAQSGYWASARSAKGWRIELADTETPDNWESYATALLGHPDAEVLSVLDPARSGARIALVEDGVLTGALFVARTPVPVSRNHLASLLGDAPSDALAGRPAADRPDPGTTICACFDVEVNTSQRARADQQLMSVEAIGKALNAGTNCGSCRPELADLLATVQVQQAAE